MGRSYRHRIKSNSTVAIILHTKGLPTTLTLSKKKNVLIDTVWKPFAADFVKNLEQEIDLSKIDAIIHNHGEVDHSGGLPALMELIPDCQSTVLPKGRF